MQSKWTKNIINLAILGLLPVYILIHTYLLPDTISQVGITDPGFVSVITLTFLGCALLSLLTLAFNKNLKSSRITITAITYVILIYFLREADFHRLFTLEHVTKDKFFTMQGVPLWQKIFVALVILLFILCLVYMLFKFIRMFWKNIRIYEPWAVAVVLWFIVLFVSQLCDKSGLNDIHIGRVIEECAECWAAIFIFLALIQTMPMIFTQKSSNVLSVNLG